VTDRPGHDFRYSVDASKIKNELDWAPAQDFDALLTQTVSWYLDRYSS
jgi:dTDP-glucose 4,6-dehydratase